MKTVLMIAPYFIPRRRVGALRPFKFAVHLQHFGFKPVVLTIESGNDHCTDREKELLKGVDIISLKSVIDRTQPMRRKSEPEMVANKRAGGIGEKLLGFIDRHTPVDTWIYFLRFRYRYILKQVRKADPDLIWATGDPWSSLWLGEKISKVMKKPLITDFRDPWTLSAVNLRKRSSYALKADKNVEKRIIDNSDKVVFTSGYTGGIYKRHYNLPEQKCEVIYNSIDTDLLQERWEKQWKQTFNPEFLNILFFGRFRRLSPVTPALLWLEALQTCAPELASSVRLHSFGMPDNEQIKELNSSPFLSSFQFHEPVLPEMRRNVLQKADLLLLTTHPERDGVIPAKFWDYLDSGKPVLSLLRHPEVREILAEHHAGYQPDWRTNGYTQAAEWTCTLMENPGENETYRAGLSSGTAQQIYSSLNAARKLATCFQQVLEQKPERFQDRE